MTQISLRLRSVSLPAIPLAREPLVVFVHTTRYMKNEDDIEYVAVYEHNRGFARAADALADECDIFLYRDMLYNMPFGANVAPPYYCVTRGRYIGVFAVNGWDSVAPEVQGVAGACYCEVNSLEAGEAIVRRAIEEGEAEVFCHYEQTTSMFATIIRGSQTRRFTCRF
ncbi:hypothetical protein M405DRAFT_866307 [Rhizopogon salebrosus TDB-379]|nr:hypothetical protein M405DRAFT_866307 [Rhizopogon salebrosus TDB-379]